MKSLFTLCVILVSTTSALAVVRIANNSTPSPGQYSTIQAAIDASAAGDTIYVAGTDINYGSATLNKQLTFIGPGVVVSGASYNKVAQLNTISMTAVAASGSKFLSIRFFQLNSSDAAISLFSNITVQRCIVDDCLFLGNDDWTGCLVEGCVFTSSGPAITGNNSAANMVSSTIRNNIFNGTIYYAANDIITHNIFCGNANGNLNIFVTTANNTFHNNIAIGRNCNSVDGTSNSTANMSFSCLNPNFPGAGNYPSTDPQFVNYTTGFFSWLHDFNLQVTSPAIGNGTGGTNIGLYGGDGKYRKDLEPNIPVVRSAVITGGNVVPQNSTLNITINSVTHE